MKRILITSCAIGAFCLIPAVQAVDYVQCREMLRTRNEMVDKAARAELSYLDKLRGNECDDEKFQVLSSPSRNLGYGIKTTAIYSTDYKAQRACKEEWLGKLERVQKPFVAWDGSKLWAPEAVSWAKSQAKVVADMKNAGCPYQ